MSPANARRGGPLDGEPFVRLLGPVQFVTADGVCIDLPSVTQRQVLAALALEPGATLRHDLLCDRLGVSAGSLRTTVSRLRGRVGVEAIATDALGYRITCRTDAAAFETLLLDRDRFPDRVEALRSALDLWSGPALDEFRHEAWGEASVFRLDELHDLAVEELAEAQIELGRAGEAVAALEAHVARRPLRDHARGLQIRALASVGRQADSLRAYQAYRRHLAEETGTEPSANVTSIEQRVAAGWDGSKAPAEAKEATGFEVLLPAALTADPGDRHIGRAAAMAVLGEELAAVIAGGSARGVLVSGEAGIGKTTLVGSFASCLHRDGKATILYGRCSDGAADPLQPFRSVVGAVVDAAPTEVLAAHARHCGGDLQRIAPRIANRTWVPAPTSADEATERHLLFEAVADLLARTAEQRPLVVVLEDLHWAEPTALLLLRHLASSLGAAPILLVATFRDRASDQSDGLRATLADLDRSGIRRLALVGFDDEELGRLVQVIVESTAPISPAVLIALRRQTAGNALYASQLTRHLLDVGAIAADGREVSLARPLDEVEVPANLADLAWSRVRALGDATPEILGSASVLGTTFDEQLLPILSGRSAADVDVALAAGLRAGLLVTEPEGDHRLRFVHALVARALYADLDPANRQRQHHLAADALEDDAEHLALRTVIQLERHRSLAGELAEAQRWATLAGDRSMAQLASAEAARWYHTALERARHLDRPEPEIADLLVRLAVAQMRSGRIDQATTTAAQAAELARRSGANQVFVQAVLATDRGYVRVAAANVAQLDLVEAALLVADPADVTTCARLLALHALELVHTARNHDREQSARSAMELTEQADDPVLLAKLVSSLSYALWGLGPFEVRADLVRRAAQAVRASTDPLLHFWASRASYHVAIEAADFEQATVSLARMRTIGRRLGEQRLAWNVGIIDAFEATMAGHLDEAEALVEANLELGLEIGQTDALAIYGGQLFVVRSFAGRYTELMPLLDELVKANPGVIPFSLAWAIACAVADRRPEAQAVLDAGLAEGFTPSSDHFGLTTVVGYAVLALELEDQAAAQILYDALVPYAGQVAFNGATSQGPVVAYLGKLATLLDRYGLAEAHLHEALAITQQRTWRYHEATTLLALAQLQLRSTGTLDEAARNGLGQARAIAQECGLALVLTQIDDLHT